MNLCSDGHDEVCFEGTSCPACKELNKRDAILAQLSRELKELEQQQGLAKALVLR